MFYPDDSCFDGRFFLQILKNKKKVKIIINIKLLKLSEFGYAQLPYYTKSNNLTKDHIAEVVMGDKEMLDYLPDEVNFKNITREFLLSVNIISKIS